MMCDVDSRPVPTLAQPHFGSMTTWSPSSYRRMLRPVSFSGVDIPGTAVKLEVLLTHGDKQRGIHQADVERIQ